MAKISITKTLIRYNRNILKKQKNKTKKEQRRCSFFYKFEICFEKVHNPNRNLL